jgi:hypothetical protein
MGTLSVHRNSACIQNNYVKNPRSNYRVDLFASQLKEASHSMDTERDGFSRIFQKEWTLYGNGYYEKEEGRPYTKGVN